MSASPLRSISAGLAAAFIAAVHAPGCMLDRRGTTGGEDSGGSGGAPASCETPADCGKASACSNPKCTDGTCAIHHDDAGTPCLGTGNFCNGKGVCLPSSCTDDAECDTCSLEGLGPGYAEQRGVCENEACTSGSLTSCGNYVCGRTTCKTDCMANTDCIEGTRCDEGVCGNSGGGGATR